MKMLLMRICKRCEALLNFTASHHKRGLSTKVIAVSKENDEVLKNLGFMQHDYERVLPKKRTIRELNLQRVVEMLNSLGFTTEDIQKQPNVLKLHPYSIDHRFKILEESGVDKAKITLKRISKFPRLNNVLIRDLKSDSVIPGETDVVHNILSFSNLPTELYPPKTSDDEKYGNAHATALQSYFSWRLGLSKKEVKSKYQSYVDLHLRSIRIVMQCYDVLVNQFQMAEDKIKQNIYLLSCHHKNFLEILDLIPKIGDTSIKHIAGINPKVLVRPPYKMLNILEILKKYNVPDESVVLYSKVLTLSPRTVSERAAALYADPVFNPFFSSPRICFAIIRYNIYTSRYSLLKDMKWRCLSINLLTSFHQNFQKRINLGHDETRGVEIVHYLKRHLGYGNKELHKQLRLHPFFYLTPLSVITETLELLLQNGMEKSEIFKALPIVLYPKEKVARWLEQVHSQPEVQQLRDEEGSLSPSVVLQLVLYYMERPYHFSGHGVWSEQDVSNSP